MEIGCPTHSFLKALGHSLVRVRNKALTVALGSRIHTSHDASVKHILTIFFLAVLQLHGDP